MRHPTYILIVSLAATCLAACSPGEAVAGGPAETAEEPESNTDEQPEPESEARTHVDFSRYTWLEGQSERPLVPLAARFPTPDGFERVRVAESSFDAFLRGLPVYGDKTSVRAYDGRAIRAPSAAVIALDIGDRNLQQCADTAIRLHAEYLWSSDRRDEIVYHFTSGDRSGWAAWSGGERFRIRGSEVSRYHTGRRASGREAFRAYLEHVFMYAGTRSLRYDSAPAESLSPGTLFVAPGSPGHAVILLDVAENDDGERLALIGQGFMPAQELHVLKGNGDDTVDQVWWRLPEADGELDTPSWQPFSRDDARRFTTSGG